MLNLNTKKTRIGPMPNVMAALPNIGSALCSTPQSLADSSYYTVSQKTSHLWLAILPWHTQSDYDNFWQKCFKKVTNQTMSCFPTSPI